MAPVLTEKLTEMKLNLKRTWMALLLMSVFFFSCATYNKSMDRYYADVGSENYDKALKKLDKNRLIKRDRNRLLYFMEAGHVYRLKGDLVESNRYFNQADDYIESEKKSAKDVALSNLLNPMMQSYHGEDYEQFMLHYYKALNYSALGQMEDAVVEARRITLSTEAQNDKFKNKDSRYSKDAFAFNLQGMIYEMAGDINNAFISYRNAVEVYINAGNTYYGVTIPDQLKQDLLRSADAMGFTDDLAHYQALFGTTFTNQPKAIGEAVIFLEEGQAPVKEEKNFFLTTVGGSIGAFSYVDADGSNSTIPFNYSSYGILENKLTSIRSLRVAMPVYRINYSLPVLKTVAVNGIAFQPQLLQNLNDVATNILKERFVTELANAMARQLTKKLLEKGTQAATEGIAKSSDKKSDGGTNKEKEDKERKRQENAKVAGEAAGLIMNLVNTITEKADTRNWQSLPAFVSYVRVPLQEGENTIIINTNGVSKTVKAIGGKGLQLIGLNVN